MISNIRYTSLIANITHIRCTNITFFVTNIHIRFTNQIMFYLPKLARGSAEVCLAKEQGIGGAWNRQSTIERHFTVN